MSNTDFVKSETEVNYVIKMQCRDNEGNLLAYNNNVAEWSILAQRERWVEMYGRAAHVVSINFFQI